MSARADFWRAVLRGARQGARSPVFWVYVGLLLYGASRIAWASPWGNGSTTRESWRLFDLFHETLAGVLILLLPSVSHLAMARGRGALWALPGEERQRVVVRWSVRASGSVTGVLVEDEQVRDTPFGQCLTALVRGWSFPRHRVPSAEPVRFPFTY